MKGKEVKALKGLMAGIEKFKYVLLVALVGAVLLLWPSQNQKNPAGEVSQAVVSTQSINGFDLGQMERRLSAALSKIDGAGEVTVLLTVRNSPRQILAVDEQESDEAFQAETVVVSKGSGNQETVLVEQIYPDYQGALIVCSGADDSTIRLKLVEAVAALTGLGADKISICKGK